MGNNGMASSIECKASKVTVSGQGCGTAYIPSAVMSEKEAQPERKRDAETAGKEKRKRSRGQPPAAVEKDATRRGGGKEKNRDKKR